MKKKPRLPSRTNPPRLYRVVLLPEGEVAAERLSLREAIAWIEGYNEVMRRTLPHAVIVENRIEQHVA